MPAHRKPIAVVTTVGSLADAQAMARTLVERRLAACAQISEIESFRAFRAFRSSAPISIGLPSPRITDDARSEPPSPELVCYLRPL